VAIAVDCPHCGKQLKVKEELAGRKGKCPQCQKAFLIQPANALAGQAVGKSQSPRSAPVAEPLPSDNGYSESPTSQPTSVFAPAEAAPGQVRELLLAGFSGQMTPPQTGFMRKLGALAVLAILAVMPLFYAAVIGAVAFGMYWLATSNILAHQHPAIFWAAEIAAGLILVCLIKPLIEPQRRGVETYPLDMAKEDLLKELTAKICQQIDAPLPKSIHLECSTRVAAINRGGVRLTFGLPVVASLSASQFAALMAGQLALHRPKAGSRVVNMIRGINYWLWRSVYGKGRFDRWLALVAQRRHFHLAKLLLPLVLMRLPAQAVLFIPMFIANTIAMGVVRSAEFDADRAATRLVGKATFAGLLERLEQIDFTWDGVLADLAFLNTEQRLPESLPHQVALRMLDMSPELCAALRETVNKPDEKPFDSRPSTPDRLEAIASESPDGAFKCDLPARSLLADYEAIARRMTADFYAGRFGKQARSA
jgi:hypothetical protein